MLSKEFLIQHLKGLIRVVEESDGDDDVLRQIRKELFFPCFWDRENANRLSRLEKKVDELLKRPEHTCYLLSEEGNNLLQLMINVGDRDEAINHLHKAFKGARTLTICDPYFLRCNRKQSENSYLSGVGSVIPNTVKSIELFVKPRQRETAIASGFNKLCKERNIKLTCQKSDELHDRVWIINWERAFVIGASFNGLGEKCAFFLELPEKDTKDFLNELKKVREGAHQSKSA